MRVPFYCSCYDNNEVMITNFTVFVEVSEFEYELIQGAKSVSETFRYCSNLCDLYAEVEETAKKSPLYPEETSLLQIDF